MAVAVSISCWAQGRQLVGPVLLAPCREFLALAATVRWKGLLVSRLAPRDVAGKWRAPDGEVTIEATPNGPYLVTGAVELRDSNGRILPAKGKVWLCRCGASTNKPLGCGCSLVPQLAVTNSPGLSGWSISGAATPPLSRTWMPSTPMVSPSSIYTQPVAGDRGLRER